MILRGRSNVSQDKYSGADSQTKRAIRVVSSSR